ncbi:TlpA family protein disulfide reductase [Salisaeta longa]|uniref:TlpA family protein disulfide reductase n=1 Tax=Salisaeta longa TaxID=503170 RepID=UPI0003B3D94E|nr:TlpA disulfide reductase family protein [Salisaeta longa]
MTRLLSAALIGLFVTLSGCGKSSDAPDPSEAPRTTQAVTQDLVRDVTPPQPVPDTTVATLRGDSLALASHDGVLLINFWATWCPPCRAEIPDLVELQRAMGPAGLTIVGVALDREGASKVRPFVREYEINYPIVIDSTGALDDPLGPIMGLPTTLVVNREGKIVQRVLGVFPVERMRDDLQRLLNNDR